MRFPNQCFLATALAAALVGCSKKTEAPPSAVVEQSATPTNAPAPEQAGPPAQIANVQQVNANWDAVAKEIANQNYENAVRAWAAMDQAQRQAQMNEAVRKEYERRFYQAQEALRQKAETDPKAREAYQAMTRAVLRR